MTDLDRQRVPVDGSPRGAGGHGDPASRGAGAPVTYEAARAELEEVVRRLEAGGCSLEESLALWERGEELAAVCQRLLDGARARLAGQRPAEPGTGGSPDPANPPGS
ncbi:Exodeoxyribonuclease VII small subunit [Frankia sp. EI5c]|uniref:exodeoxyribonuclease VII small subunit n=1 Tax=Frankia sp. EI5c TaxID=683316 RepID=UPI0007C203A6|nr:exodeoxyribonuclease VII small subunit [Frankia sp. EI5c]OAA24211.1 Exodeoxyribonuclease VII small subunit [Frankia sp. EI5c]